MSGSQLSKAKDDAAAIMRAKQAAGKLRSFLRSRLYAMSGFRTAWKRVVGLDT
jgi:hypothetical protein